MHIKRMHEMIENLTSCTKSAIEANKTHIGQYPISEVVDMIKDLAEAEYYARISKAMEEAEEEDEAEEKYMLQRMKEEYGEDNGQRYYNDWRYANGRYAPRGKGKRTRGYTEPIIHDVMYPQEVYRDWDRWNGDGMGRMYYPDKNHYDVNMNGLDGDYIRGYSDGQKSMEGMRTESRLERARRGYEEAQRTADKNTQDGKQSRMKSAENLANEIENEIKNRLPDMTNEERTLMKAKIAKWGTLVQ